MKFLVLFLFIQVFSIYSVEQKDKGKYTKTVYRVLESFTNNDFKKASTYFSNRFKKQPLIHSLKETWNYQQSLYGPFLEVLYSELARSSSGFKLKALLQMTSQNLAMQFSFTPNGKIKSYQFLKLTDIQIPKYKTPPYVKTNKFESQLIELGGTVSPIQAKIYLPKAKPIKNTLIFLHDFGPRDMYHRDGVNSYYRDIAEGLASNSIASILFNKRSFSYEAKSISQLNPGWEILRDLYGVIFKVKSHPKLQNTKITVVLNGFSTYLSSYLANQKIFDQFILLNPSFRHPLKTLFEKEEFFLRDKPSNETALLKLHDRIQDFFQNKNTKDQDLFFNYPVSYYRSLKKYAPTVIPSHIQAEFLLLSAGEAYSQNPSDIPLLHSVLKKQKVTEHTFFELNHIFHVGKVLQTSQNIHTQGIVSAKVILIIKNWLEEHSKSSK